MKVVINTCFGGYGLSRQAVERLIELGSETAKTYFEEIIEWDVKSPYSTDSFYVFDDDRSNTLLVQVVEELKEKSWGRFAELKVVEIPDDVKWYIHDYDGMETIHEEHRSWG